MKINLLAVLAVLGFVGVADAATSINMTNADGDTIIVKSGNGGYRSSRRTTTKRTTTKRAHMYDNLGGNTINGDVYVIGDDKVGKDDVESTETVSTTTPKTKQTYVQGETYKKTAKRKYFIANPFYQPLKNQFGTVTTGEYMQGTYMFGGIDRKLTEWSIKEDLSFGITDKIALQGMAKYSFDKLLWKNDSNGEREEYKNNDLNVYGLGIQGRIIDTDNWISTLSGYYQHQKHGVDYFIADLKAGYKTGPSTIYGLARVWGINMESDVYGDYMENTTVTNDWAFLMYGNSKDTIFMGEGGLGVWTVLDEDWTLNVEGMYGMYDWHNQLSIKGAFGWQPNDYFALNLYAKASLHDSANGKTLHLLSESLPLNGTNWANAWNNDWNDLTNHGHALVEVSKYKEWSVGLQVMFQF